MRREKPRTPLRRSGWGSKRLGAGPGPIGLLHAYNNTSAAGSLLSGPRLTLCGEPVPSPNSCSAGPMFGMEWIRSIYQRSSELGNQRTE